MSRPRSSRSPGRSSSPPRLSSGSLPDGSLLPALVPRFFLGGPLRGRVDLEPLVRNRGAALDRDAVGAGGEPLLGTFDRLELAAQSVGEAFVELVLVQLRPLVAEMLVDR